MSCTPPRHPLCAPAAALALLLPVTACGPADPAGGDPDGGPGGADSGSTTGDPDATVAVGDPTAVLMTLPGQTPELAVMTLQPDGTLEDNALRIPLGPSPREIAVRSDGREAAAVWAGTGPGNPKGVVVVDLEPDGSAASKAELGFGDIDLGSQNSPTDITYVTDDELLVTLRGPDPDSVVSFVRGAAGWEPGPTFSCGEDAEEECLEGPLEIHAITSDLVLVLRNQFTSNYSQVEVIERNGDSWTRVGEFTEIWGQPIELAPHPGASYAYLPTREPDTAIDLNPLGLLHTIRPAGQGQPWQEMGNGTPLSASASQIAMDPAGQFVVLNDPVGEINEQGQIVIERYQLHTIDIGDPDGPDELDGPMPELSAFMLYDFKVAANGLLVIIAQRPLGNDSIKIDALVLRQSEPGNWVEVKAPVSLDRAVDAIEIVH